MAFSPSFLFLIFLAFFLSLSSSLGYAATDTNTRKTFNIAVRNDLKPSVFSDVDNWYISILHALSSSTHSLESSSRGTRGRHMPLHMYAGNASLSDWKASMAAFCDHGSLDPDKVRGKIVLCDLGVLSRFEKGLVVKKAGGAAMIVATDPAYGEFATPDAHCWGCGAPKPWEATRQGILVRFKTNKSRAFPRAIAFWEVG